MEQLLERTCSFMVYLGQLWAARRLLQLKAAVFWVRSQQNLLILYRCCPVQGVDADRVSSSGGEDCLSKALGGLTSLPLALLALRFGFGAAFRNQDEDILDG